MLSGGGYYLSVNDDGKGNLTLGHTNDPSKAAKVYFATPTNVAASDPLRNSVNHIDIAIRGSSDVTIPLAYGKYYDADGNVIHNVSSDNPLKLSLNADVGITTDDMKKALSRFAAGYATEEDTQDAIRALYEKEGYVIDPHTAVAASVYGKLRKEGLGAEPCVIASTASPFKFEKSVMKALGEDTSLSDLELADRLSAIAGVKVPAAVESLRSAKVRHTTVCGKSRDEMLAEVRKFLGI